MELTAEDRDLYDLSEFLPPAFESVDAERLHRKRMLAVTFRLFGRFGFSEGAAGHVTARDPEHPDFFWVNRFGQHFSTIRVSDLLLVDHDGRVVEGEGQVNVAAFAIHSRVHAARPDVISAAHTHSIYGRSWSTLGQLLDPLTQDACAFYRDHVVFENYTGVVFTVEEGKLIADALGPHKAAILRNHGLLTVGRTVEEAAWWYIALERCCQVQLMAEAAGTPTRIDEETAVRTAKDTGSDIAAHISLTPLRTLVTRQEPDLFD